MQAILAPASRFCVRDIGCRQPTMIRAAQRSCEFLSTFARGSLTSRFQPGRVGKRLYCLPTRTSGVIGGKTKIRLPTLLHCRSTTGESQRASA
jgi:hypothetical protein